MSNPPITSLGMDTSLFTHWQHRGMRLITIRWQSCTQLNVSYQVLTSLHDLHLIEKRAVNTNFKPETQWRKAA